MKLVPWNPDGLVYIPTELTAVMVPLGELTEREWLEALVERVNKMVQDEPDLDKAASQAARYLRTPMSETWEFGEAAIINNEALRVQFNLAMWDGPIFPVEVIQGDPRAQEAIDECDFWLWVELAKAQVSTHTLE